MGAEMPFLVAGQLTRAGGAALPADHREAGVPAARPVLLTGARIAGTVAVFASLVVRRYRPG